MAIKIKVFESAGSSITFTVNGKSAGGSIYVYYSTDYSAIASTATWTLAGSLTATTSGRTIGTVTGNLNGQTVWFAMSNSGGPTLEYYGSDTSTSAYPSSPASGTCDITSQVVSNGITVYVTSTATPLQLC